MRQQSHSRFSVPSVIFGILCVMLLILITLPSRVAAQGTSTISGIIFLNSTETLSSSALVTIQLADITTSNAPAIVVTERVFSTSGAQAPFSFSLPYDPTKIDVTHRYTIQGHIQVAGQTMYTTSAIHPVITFDNPTINLQISMRKVATAGMPPASAGTTPLLVAAGLLLVGLSIAFLRRKMLVV